MSKIISWSPQLSRLQDVLVYLLPSEADGLIICQEAGMAIDRIDFRDPSHTRWFHILDQATKQNRMERLIRASLKRYDNNRQLIDAIAEWRKAEPIQMTPLIVDLPKSPATAEGIEDIASLTYLLRSMRKDMSSQEERLRGLEIWRRDLSVMTMPPMTANDRQEEAD